MMNKRLKLAHLVAELFDSRLPYFKGARQIRLFLTENLAPALRPPQIVSTRYGFDITVTTAHDSIDQNLYTQGTYEAGTLNIIRACLRDGDTFLDIGANIGLMSLLGSMQVGKTGIVYAFEPEPDTFNLLQQNISLNQTGNIHAMNFGLGSATENHQIYRNRHDNRGMASFVERSEDAVESLEVSVKTLDSFLVEKRVESVRMMKIDVEGWELEVLKGATQLLSGARAPIIAIEYNTSFPFHREMYDLITSINNYQVFILAHSNWHASRLLPVRNAHDLPVKGSPNLFCFLPVHLRALDKDLFHA